MARCIEEKKYMHTTCRHKSGKPCDRVVLQTTDFNYQMKLCKKNKTRLICKQVQVLIELAFLANYKQVSVTALSTPPDNIHTRAIVIYQNMERKKKASGTAESLCCGWGSGVVPFLSLLSSATNSF